MVDAWFMSDQLTGEISRLMTKLSYYEDVKTRWAKMLKGLV